MRMFLRARAILAALLASAGISTVARADVKDYEFQLADQAVKIGPHAVIAVRLVNKVTGKPVADAVIFALRLDMAPDSMAQMTTKISQLPGAESGNYRFDANVGMSGHWQLSLGAKVQGESGTLESHLIIPAQP